MYCFPIMLTLLLMLGACNMAPKHSHSLWIDINQPASSVQRLLTHKHHWAQWWPGQQQDSTRFLFENYLYQIDKITWDGFAARVGKNGSQQNIYLQIIPKEGAKSSIHISSDPITEPEIFKAQLEKDGHEELLLHLENLLIQLHKYFTPTENIYGLAIQQQKVLDSSFMSMNRSFNHSPDTKDLYEMVHDLKQYIQEQHGVENNVPILHVHQTGPQQYNALVAIATQRDVPSNPPFQLKKMVLGNILMAEIKGGPHRIASAQQQLENYMYDYKKSNPAIPFQALVTDRSLVRDTSQWITRLYYPVFH